MQKIKQIFNKTNFDYSDGYVNPLQFHSIVYFVMKAYGVLDELVPAWSGFLIAFMICCAVPALGLCALALYNGWQILDAAVLIEAGTYAIVISYKLWILSCTKLNIREFHDLLRILREDFKYICTTDGRRYRERFFVNQLQTWKICIVVAVVMSSICVGMVFFAILCLIYYLLTHNQESQGQRPLLFPFWFFGIDFSKSPTYEIAFTYSNICIISYGYNYVFMIVTQILWIREIATKADLVIWGIQDLMNGVYPATNEMEANMFKNIIKHRMRAIIQQHHAMYELMESYSRVYKKLLMFEQIFCGPVACLTAYSAVEKLEVGEVNYILILLCVAAIIVAFVPSYLCTFLRVKVSSVLNACWDTPFWNAGTIIRPYLVLMIQRSIQPLPLRFGGFEEVSVQTFASITLILVLKLPVSIFALRAAASVNTDSGCLRERRTSCDNS